MSKNSIEGNEPIQKRKEWINKQITQKNKKGVINDAQRSNGPSPTYSYAIQMSSSIGRIKPLDR